MYLLPESYERIFNEVRFLITNAYKDSFILKYFRLIQLDNKVVILHGGTKGVLQHIINVIKSDYVLLMWKINIDPSNSVSTINKLYKMLEKEEIKDAVVREGRPKKFKKTINQIESYRNQRISHFDYQMELEKLDILMVDELLEYYRKYFNRFALDGHEELRIISDSEIMRIQMDVEFGLKMLIREYISAEEENGIC